MRIPLDYYRILGTPLAASDEQLRQAYSDRILQLPRREYSQTAISSRKQLIEEAYVVLSNPKERKAYDKVYLAQAYEQKNTHDATTTVERLETENRSDLQAVGIDISSDKLLGALLILQELGEYELVLKLGRPYIVNQNGVALATSGNILERDRHNPNVVDRQDVVLTVALACLELGREEWQQSHYENAATSLETGEELLAREGSFPKVQAEIQADIYRLRPYRILELLTLPQEEITQRNKGLKLLQEILDQRGGIDGLGNDQSGLNIDDFLRFIQQLRKYLTVAEQHELFVAESKRPSSVAIYLAVYALIARGFAQRQPALIRQAKKMLISLGKRQDVHLEQSLCALLLGQTQEATRALELSQEYEALAFIREHSQDSPDLLPGLCLYGETWLENEVFPHFQDLAGQKASLKDYFAQQEVQAYLEALPMEAENSYEASWENLQINRPYRSTSTRFDEQPTRVSQRQAQNKHESHYSWSANSGNGKTVDPLPSGTHNEAAHSLNGRNKTTTPRQPEKTRRPRSSTQRIIEHGYASRRRPIRTAPAKRNRRLQKVLIFLIGILVLWFSATTTVFWLKNFFSPATSTSDLHLSVQINQPPLTIPKSDDKFKLPTEPLTTSTAEQLIQAWLSIKTIAMGPTHDIDSLKQILVNPALYKWQLVAQQEKAKNFYRKYEHTLKVESLNINKTDENQATVVSTVNETTHLYENSQIKTSDQDTLKVKYNFTRVDGEWRIRDMSLINQH